MKKQEEEKLPLKGENPASAQSSKAASEDLYKQKMKIVVVVVSYFCVSMGMVFLNKVLLTEGSSIPAPLFVTWYQCIITAAIVGGLGEMGKGAPKGSFFAQFPPFEFDLDVSRRVMPLSVIFVLMISLNNLCLQYVEVSFYQVARGLTTVFNVILTYLILGEKTSRRALMCCAVIVLGFYVGVDGEVRFTLVGTLFGVGSSLFVCLNAMYTKKINSVVDNNQWKLALYNNLNATLLFPPIIVLAGETQKIADHPELLTDLFYWFKMTTAGFFGFAIGILTVFQITLTSPLTHNVMGTAKASLQTVLALMIYQNPINIKGGMGIALVLLGSALYTYVRNLEMDQAKAAAKSAGSVAQNSSTVDKEANGGSGGGGGGR